MPCDKKRFNSEKEAKKFAKIAARNFIGGRRQRAYFCLECKAFHLTTQKKTKLAKERDEKYE